MNEQLDFGTRVPPITANIRANEPGESEMKSKSMYYAGIGARATPQSVLMEMYSLAGKLANIGYVLRSGGAIGADQAFEDGAAFAKSDHEIYLPAMSSKAAEEIAAQYHPAWDRCNSYVRKLHGRNALILLGAHLDKPVDFVVCWTPGGARRGGTGQSIRMAEGLGIRVINLALSEFPKGILK